MTPRFRLSPAATQMAICVVLLAGVAAGLVAEKVLPPWAAGRPGSALLSLAMLPMAVLCAGFPILALVRNVSYLVRPLGHLRENGRTYACIPREALPPEAWPSVTIQVPVYTESFEQVIEATLRRALVAAKGKANVVVYDDGLMVLADDDLPGAEDRIEAALQAGEPLSARDREICARLRFYRGHGVAFVARSRHGRPGLFKKASNLVEGMNFGDAVAERILELAHLPEDQRLAAAHASVGVGWPRPIVAEGDVRIGEFLVLLDKDSEMPPDVIGVTLPEFLADEALAYTQHRTRPFNSHETFFAAAIGRFTEFLFYLCFAAGTADGDLPPLVGHNAFLRTAALRAVARRQEEGLVKYWEDKVSEDFDLAQRLSAAGYFGRYVAFANHDFGEGVTRTWSEEARKFGKFAYGAAEIVVNPLRDVPRLGLLTPTFRAYLRGRSVPAHSKAFILFYLVSYFTLAAPVVVVPTVLLALALGATPADLGVQTVWSSAQNITIFLVLGGVVSYFVRRELVAWRGFGLREQPAAAQAVRDLGAALVLVLFFGSVSWVCFQGIVGHLFGLRPHFGATNMDALEDEPVSQVVVAIGRESGAQLVACAAAALGLVIASFQPGGVDLAGGFLLLCAAHLAAPFALNPLLVRRVGADLDRLGWLGEASEPEAVADARR